MLNISAVAVFSSSDPHIPQILRFLQANPQATNHLPPDCTKRHKPRAVISLFPFVSTSAEEGRKFLIGSWYPPIGDPEKFSKMETGFPCNETLVVADMYNSITDARCAKPRTFEVRNRRNAPMCYLIPVFYYAAPLLANCNFKLSFYPIPFDEADPGKFFGHNLLCFKMAVLI